MFIVVVIGIVVVVGLLFVRRVVCSLPRSTTDGEKSRRWDDGSVEFVLRSMNDSRRVYKIHGSTPSPPGGASVCS